MKMILRSTGLYIWAIVIALVLWVQVHGQGEGSLSMDVAMQVQGLPENMVIVNDLPDQVKITVHGLQGRLKAIDPKDVFISVDVSDLHQPGVVERGLSLHQVRLPTSIVVDKIQPDRIELQVDHIVVREVPVEPLFDLPQGWHVEQVQIEPARVSLIGPEVWMETLARIQTVPLRLELVVGAFESKTNVVSPAGKAVRLAKENATFKVQGFLRRDVPPKSELIKE
ncbi:MAG: hypothetical protein CO186_08075 [Zetaproteobacteria bacterium CG_4_9_14_3_um_filter_49_83]|nr:MAG: hypothetical protein AUJ56_08285 [Zetaproteobacteria bacterium CG1_02_49_23]PIQ34077.1 MAG: hypothetical protein COW62_03265 [Zetaproteobacteria bacterium CG17_big_fil_post_rev_8_21_14_2_50_50_13]PIV30246.1 MAG: hypothetical protein COS35_07860 [Zetaproteobacteria bacterium CG02_land_8_20_14_3_00_50_9]PIY55875.1 MAG: hypothetical protein COZ00_07075 [Zetaproteobacteria bacterium CG_4_10_14_0_8_um_filter_49_80]PJA35005.1 MAG: hypothetical protein CO186_08075 [Zetaproteobacteria bacterium